MLIISSFPSIEIISTFGFFVSKVIFLFKIVTLFPKTSIASIFTVFIPSLRANSISGFPAVTALVVI